MTAAVVLFCGAGGSSLGLERAGFTTIGYDSWPPAVWVHRAALMEAHVHDLADSAQDSRIARDANLWWASPPCQPFSTAGRRRGADDARDGWPWTLRLLAKNGPEVLIAENVEGMTHEGEPAEYLDRIIASLWDMGYDARWRVLNCADYGVPQTRRRLFIVARRDGRAIRWPAVTHTPIPGLFTERWVTMANALGWGMAQRPMFTIATKTDTFGGSRTRRKMQAAADNKQSWVDTRTLYGSFDPYAQCAPTLTGKSGTQWVHRRPATTVQGDPRIAQPGHHDRQMNDAIRMEPHEAGILQGFPADYPWDAAGSRSAQFKAIGNAVPPIMAQLLAEANRPVTP